MKRLISILLSLLAANVFALDPIGNMRYTFGAESRLSPKLSIGAGARSDFSDALFFPVNITSSITNEFEIGAKLDIDTYDEMNHVLISVDLGGKYHLHQGKYVEIDGYFGLNQKNGSAVIVSYGVEQFISKNFSNFYEFRSGFLDGATGEDGYVKFAFSMTPILDFNNILRFMIEVSNSESIGRFKDDFMIDVAPKMELTLKKVRIRLDFDIGIMQEKNNDQKTIALYVMSAL